VLCTFILIPSAKAKAERMGRARAHSVADKRVEDAYFQGAYDVVTGHITVSVGAEREYVLFDPSSGMNRRMMLTPTDWSALIKGGWNPERMRASRTEPPPGSAYRPRSGLRAGDHGQRIAPDSHQSVEFPTVTSTLSATSSERAGSSRDHKEQAAFPGP